MLLVDLVTVRMKPSEMYLVINNTHVKHTKVTDVGQNTDISSKYTD